MRLLMDRPQALAEPWRRFFARDGGIGLLYGNVPLTRLALYGITLAARSGYSTARIPSMRTWSRGGRASGSLHPKPFLRAFTWRARSPVIR